MSDLYYREQQIFDDAARHLAEIYNGAICDADKYETIVEEYGKLLKQLKRVTKISDRITGGLNTVKLDLLDKVHYDALTDIYNRRFLEESMVHIIKTVSRLGGDYIKRADEALYMSKHGGRNRYTFLNFKEDS